MFRSAESAKKMESRLHELVRIESGRDRNDPLEEDLEWDLNSNNMEGEEEEETKGQNSFHSRN